MVSVLIGPLLPAEPGLVGAEADGGGRVSVVFVWPDAVAVKYVCAAELIYEVVLSELGGFAELFELVDTEDGDRKLLEPAVDEAMLGQADTNSYQLYRLSYRVERLTSNRRQNSRRACWRWLYQIVSFN